MVLPFVRSLDHILLPLMWACTPSTFVACPLRFNHPVEQSKCLQMVRIKRVLTRQTLVSSDKGCRVLAVFVHFLPLRVDDCISDVRFPFFCSALNRFQLLACRTVAACGEGEGDLSPVCTHARFAGVLVDFLYVCWLFSSPALVQKGICATYGLRNFMRIGQAAALQHLQLPRPKRTRPGKVHN